MKGLDYIKTKQTSWAKRNGLNLLPGRGDQGLHIYTDNLDGNLFEPLTESTRNQFECADGGEINDHENSLSKMRALHSSSAIAVNIFQYWGKINKVHQIAHACGLCNKENQNSEMVKFEEKYPISKSFQFGPNIDVVIENNEKAQYEVFAIECKFSEAYGSYSQKGIDKKYIDLDIWKDIPNTLSLAKSISSNDIKSNFFNPAQLIKHILGLKNRHKKKAFRLLYLWYDVPGTESYLHRQEIEKFAETVKKDGIKFSAMSYQKLIGNLVKNYYPGNEKYIDYITDRYL